MPRCSSSNSNSNSSSNHSYSDRRLATPLMPPCRRRSNSHGNSNNRVAACLTATLLAALKAPRRRDSSHSHSHSTQSSRHHNSCANVQSGRRAVLPLGPPATSKCRICGLIKCNSITRRRRFPGIRAATRCSLAATRCSLAAIQGPLRLGASAKPAWYKTVVLATRAPPSVGGR